MINKNERLPNPPDNKCVKCRTGLLIFKSMFYKVCVDCGQEYNFPLKDKQKPMIQHQR